MSKTEASGFSAVAKIELIRATCGLRLPQYETRLLVILISLIEEKSGLAFPPRSLLAKLLGTDQRNTWRRLKGLQERCLISVAETGTNRRAARYRINAELILKGIGVCGDAADASVETQQARLYGRIRRVCGDAAGASVGTPEEQLSASEVQTKQQAKLSPRSARSRSPGARAHAGARRNAWRAKYRPAAD